MKSLLKNIIIFVVLAGIIYFVYTNFFANNDLSLNTSSSNNEGEQITREFVMRLNELEQINFSSSIFTDPRFRSLTSFSTSPDSSVSSGRPNPFAR